MRKSCRSRVCVPEVVYLEPELIDIPVYTNGSDHFVLRNAGVQLTISKGRISSLVDVKLG